MQAYNDRSTLSTFRRRLQWALVALATCWVLWLRSPVLTPFVLAALLGWLGDSLVDRIQARGVPRHGGVIVVFSAMAAVTLLGLLLLLPPLQLQLVNLVGSLPNYRDWVVRLALPLLAACNVQAMAEWRAAGVLSQMAGSTSKLVGDG